ncbi:hypothetical protein FHX42_003529 [Saccharopolyspora lacisalsi]|uniref:Necrosis inducing protein (NPP1) n=2 Tax=Halosaccharopolyspora lacisalsi TaxID=1000566 RepID=A0A839DYR5_9PSEU|nr:hypothetical protein [Halosaccharopolyspora lacisalsi]
MSLIGTTSPASRPESNVAWWRRVSVGLGALALSTVMSVAVAPATAWAEPPEALPSSVADPDGRWQPAFDYDGDGCYPTPAIGVDGTINPGLNNSGALDGNCHDPSDLDNTNSYARSECNNGWCAYMYALYFEKDQAVPGLDAFGHRHDLEHVVVWVRDGGVEYVSASAHGDYDTRPSSEVVFEGTHPKIVYHKDGAGTHAFRFAAEGEQAENHNGTFQYPALVSWNNFPAGIREKLVRADFGSAQLDLADARFADSLAKAEPSGIPFDPQA